jgi:anti-sigma regulatory factor (Ser/Thr protein kinase)
MTLFSGHSKTPAKVHLVAEPTAASEARSFVRSVLEDHPRIEDALLSVSELVTNAIRHGPPGDGLEVLVHRRDAAIRVSVNQKPGSLHIDRSRRAGGMGGLGLMIVEKVSDAWGVEDESGVWFEIKD